MAGSKASAKKDSIIKDALVLLVITMISGMLLGTVHQVTKSIIDERKMAEKLISYQAAYPSAASMDFDSDTEAAFKARSEALAATGSAFGNNILNEILRVKDEGGNAIGYVASVTSKDAYKNQLTVAVGMAIDGTVQNITVLEHEETPGLGSKATEEPFLSQFSGKNVDSFSAVKSGASAENEIDAVSGATFSTNAVTNAVNEALASMRAVAGI